MKIVATMKFGLVQTMTRCAGRMTAAAILIGVLISALPALADDGSIVAWGDDQYDQATVPAPNMDFVAIGAGFYHSLAVKADGSIVGFGDNTYGQLNPPSPNTGFVAVEGGEDHSLGLKADGSVVGFGNNVYGQLDVPSPNSDFIAVAAGGAHSLGLKSNGVIVGWGDNSGGQLDVPEPNSGFVAIAAGYGHSVGLRSDGTVAAWGGNSSNQLTLPDPNMNFIAIAAREDHSLALRSDGSIVGWGSNSSGQRNVPDPNSDFIAVAAGGFHGLGLKSDGSIVGWGNNNDGQTIPPMPNTGFVAIAAGGNQSLALKALVCDPPDCDDGDPCTTNECIGGVCVNNPIPNCGEDGDGPPVDGNNDGIPDDQQDHVTSVQNANGDFVTIAAPEGTMLTNVQSSGNPSPDDAPEGAEFPFGFVSFTLEGVAPGGSAVVQLFLHSESAAPINTFYKYGPTPDNPTPHWYEFAFDGTTGVTSISGNVISMTLVDGQRGDADLAANGTIVDPGAPAFAQADGNPPPLFGEICGHCACGATMSMTALLAGLMVVKVRRRKRRLR